MTYDVSGHWLLSDAAAALSTEALVARADAAELNLALPLTLTGAEAETAKLAVVHWINCQLARDGGVGVAARSESKGDQSVSVTYGKPGSSDDPCALARSLARSLAGVAPAGASTVTTNVFTW